MKFPAAFSRLLRIICLLMMGLALQACGTTKIAYNQAPTLAYFYLDGYMDFNDTQNAQVKAELVKFQAWHRQTQLPLYVELLQKVQQKMPQDITPTQACEVFAEVRQKAQAMSDFAEPSVVSVTAGFAAKQLDAMARKFAKSNATWREDYLDGNSKDMLEKRQKSAIKRSEMLYGSMTDQQRSLIAQQIDRSSFKAAQSYAERQRRQKDVLQTLGKVVASAPSMVLVSTQSSAPEQANTQKEMRALLARSIASPDAAYRSYAEQLTQEACARFAELHNTTSPEQRKKAVDVLAGYAQDFKALAAQK